MKRLILPLMIKTGIQRRQIEIFLENHTSTKQWKIDVWHRAI